MANWYYQVLCPFVGGLRGVERRVAERLRTLGLLGRPGWAGLEELLLECKVVVSLERETDTYSVANHWVTRYLGPGVGQIFGHLITLPQTGVVWGEERCEITPCLTSASPGSGLRA